MIFQDPMSALNPVLRIGDQIEEAVGAHSRPERARPAARAIELLDRVGIPAPARRLREYPHEFSGGMRQRVLIADRDRRRARGSCSPTSRRRRST